MYLTVQLLLTMEAKVQLTTTQGLYQLPIQAAIKYSNLYTTLQ